MSLRSGQGNDVAMLSVCVCLMDFLLV